MDLESERGMTMPVKTCVEERLLSKVSLGPSGCWEWCARIGTHGYGEISFRGNSTVAHRVSYRLYVGPIPAGMHLDHLCRNRACCNPAHLEAVTPQENHRRGVACITHCPQGHEYLEDTTYVCKRGKRSCTICKNDRRRKPKEAK